MNQLFQSAKEFYVQYERYVSGGALLFGFIVDSFTLTRVDLWFDNLILFSYLCVAALGILILNILDRTPPVTVLGVADTRKPVMRTLALLSMQFAFGGLFSGFVIFYSRSASLVASWPFLLLLVVLLVGNEFFRERYQRLTFQLSLLFLALFSFAIFYVPIIVKLIGPQVFVLSGIVSIAIFGAFVYILSRVIPDRVQKSKRMLTWSVVGIFLCVNVFYFTDIIPPLPLSLKSADVYHDVIRTSAGGYQVRDEDRPWHAFFDRRKDMHISPGESIYAYSAVFAPTDLATSIIHSWQHYSEEREMWVETSSISFPIVGGRDGGYRGYTMKRALAPGDWRVDVETEYGQLLGRIPFEVVHTDTTPPLRTETTP